MRRNGRGASEVNWLEGCEGKRGRGRRGVGGKREWGEEVEEKMLKWAVFPKPAEFRRRIVVSGRCNF